MKWPETPEQKIERLYAEYAGAVYDKCLRMLARRAEAEDAVQETFTKAYGLVLEKRTAKGDSELAWLYRIATYVCLHALRKRRRLRERPAEQAPEPKDGSSGNTDDRLALRQELEHILSTLDKRSQYVLVAHYIDGMGQADIAASLGISRRAVVKRLSKLRLLVGPILGSEQSHG